VDIAANVNVEGKRLLDVVHHVARARRPPNLKTFLARSARSPWRQKQVRDADDMIRVKVREKQLVNLGKVGAGLCQANGHRSSTIEQQFLAAGLDQSGGTKPIEIHRRPRSSPQQRYL